VKKQSKGAFTLVFWILTLRAADGFLTHWHKIPGWLFQV